MLDHDLAFEVGPIVARQGVVGDPNNEVALVLNDIFAVGQLQRDLATGDLNPTLSRFNPVSSTNSRKATCSSVSPASTSPPGVPQKSWPASGPRL